MEASEPIVLKSDTLKDYMPMCVAYNKKGRVFVGDSAYVSYKRDIISGNKGSLNSFFEFSRTLGTDKTYYSSNANKTFSSEDLLAEVIKTLISFEKTTTVQSAVITIPSEYMQNQIDAVRRAGKMAGLKQIEVLQEPVAAAITYSLDSKNKDGFWLVFNFGTETFASELLKIENGIIKVVDTEGDSYLGGKCLDMAIVDEIIMPYLEGNYIIDSILEDNDKKQILRNALKFYAEETKIKLFFNDTHNVFSDLGDIPGEDDNEEKFELDISITKDDMERVLTPIFQKAIAICNTLLQRNNLERSALNSLILVGEETFSPILRKMLEQQICKPNTDIDPITAIVKGVALYSSTSKLIVDLIDYNVVKDKLFELTEKEILNANTFSNYFDQLYALKEDNNQQELSRLYKNILGHEK